MQIVETVAYYWLGFLGAATFYFMAAGAWMDYAPPGRRDPWLLRPMTHALEKSSRQAARRSRGARPWSSDAYGRLMNFVRHKMWRITGLSLLAVLAMAVSCFALVRPVAPPAVSAKVASYEAPTAADALAKTVAVIGDSYAAGVGAGQPLAASGWAGRLGLNQGWSVANRAHPGTGYFTSVSEFAQETCGLGYCPRYSEMIDEVADLDPQLVLVSGGREDAKVDAELEAEAIRDFYTELRAKLPNAKIVAFNALWDSTKAPASINAMSAQVRSAAQAVGGTYVSIGQPLAGRAELISPDGVHPNPGGHVAIFEASMKELQKMGIAVR